MPKNFPGTILESKREYVRGEPVEFEKQPVEVCGEVDIGSIIPFMVFSVMYAICKGPNLDA